MDWLISWLCKGLLTLLEPFYNVIDTAVAGMFKNDVMVFVSSISDWLGAFLLVCGFMMSLYQLSEQTAQGETPNLFIFFKNFFLSSIALLIFKYLHELFIVVNHLSVTAYGDMLSKMNDFKPSSIFASDGSFFSLFLVILLLVVTFKVMFDTLTRIFEAIIYIQLFKVSVLGISYGNYQLFSSCSMKYAGLLFTQFFQRIFYYGSMYTMYVAVASGTTLDKMDNLWITLVLLLGSMKITKVVDSVMQSAVGGRGNMGHGIVQAGQMMMMYSRIPK